MEHTEETHAEHEAHVEEALHIEPEVGHADHGDGFVQGFMSLVTDPAHWAFEITGEVTSTLVVALVLAPVAKRLIARHDRKQHSTCTCTANRTITEAQEAHA